MITINAGIKKYEIVLYFAHLFVTLQADSIFLDYGSS